MARRAKVETATADDHDEVIDWYRRKLAEPPRFPWEGCRWEPVRIGPTWQTTADGTAWLLPDASVGWDVLGWCGTELQLRRGVPWRFTLEQARFILWWYAVDERGRWLDQDGVFQRLKGHGKDPVGGCLLYTEALGPCRVAYMDGDRPVATDQPDAWVQTAATSLEQTKNTMRLMPGLITPEARAHYGVQVGKEVVHALGDTRLIQAVTSSPATLEGARSTFVLKNETQHWDSSNGGHEMDAVIERNATKSADGAARALAITNAPEPGRDSVAERARDAFDKETAGRTMAHGLLYDSLEAHPEAPLAVPRLEDEPADLYEERVRATLAEIIRSVKGDSEWLDEERIVGSILDPRNPPSRSRRFWFNQLTAAEDAWTTPQEWDACADPDEALEDGTEVTLFFDGSKSDDATGLTACRVSDGKVFTLGCWQRPHGVAEWSVPRAAVDDQVRADLERLDVVGFFADPGAGEDESGERYWDRIIDGWAADYGDQLKVWAQQGGVKKHAVMWDMRSPARTQLFTEECERVLADIYASVKAAEDGSPRPFTHDADPNLRTHAVNARRRPNQYGVSIGKEHRESARKIDLVVCAIGSRLVRRQYLALDPRKRRKRTGRAAFV